MNGNVMEIVLSNIKRMLQYEWQNMPSPTFQLCIDRIKGIYNQPMLLTIFLIHLFFLFFDICLWVIHSVSAALGICVNYAWNVHSCSVEWTMTFRICLVGDIFT